MSGGNGENRPRPNSYWLVQGRFAAGEYPGALKPDEDERKVTALLKAGIDHFIDLTGEGELVPYSEIAREAGRRLGVDVGYERRPIPTWECPAALKT